MRGERPEVLYWSASSEQASAEIFAELAATAAADPEKQDPKANATRRRRGPQLAIYENTETGVAAPSVWSWTQAAHAWAPATTRPAVPEQNEFVTVLPVGHQHYFELGNRLPEKGTLRVRVRANAGSTDPKLVPSLALDFGWQADGDWRGSARISSEDLVIDAPPGKSKFYQWDIPLSEIHTRNPMRKTVTLGDKALSNPSEYIRLHNTSLASAADIQLDYIEVMAPVYEQWPSASHVNIFGASEKNGDENVAAREIVSRFMKRAWRRTVTAAEVDRKMAHFARIRPVCDDFQQAVVETLAVVLSSPHFLYLIQREGPQSEDHRPLNPFELATRLAMFLWCSTPDDELINLAAAGRLSDTDELVRQTSRMLADPKHERFSKHFVRQWLDLGLLDFLNVDDDTYPDFDDTLKASMQQEPVAFFENVLQHNRSVIDFIHADYALVNQRLAQHYGIPDVYGQYFRKVPLPSHLNRGGVLTQAGLLAMNSDGKDSNPLQRGIWMLERILNDPPPPPPPVVPEIDLTDPEILKMTLKERMEDHRNDPACYSCHAKIDPWGIALENFDAVGSWRTEVQGKDVDASSELFNQQKLDGIGGLKRYLLANRQDQFSRAMVYKLATFALGRPLGFSDHAGIESLTAELRREGDGLATLVSLLVTSELFKSR